MSRFVLRLVTALMAWLGLIASAYASTTGGLPWDTPLQTIANDLTGPVATALSTGGLFAAGGTLMSYSQMLCIKFSGGRPGDRNRWFLLSGSRFSR